MKSLRRFGIAAALVFMVAGLASASELTAAAETCGDYYPIPGWLRECLFWLVANLC